MSRLLLYTTPIITDGRNKGFWRKNIPDYSQIVNPLYHVSGKKNDLKWGPEKQKAFEQLKYETVHTVDLGPIRTGQDLHCCILQENCPSWRLWQKYLGSLENNLWHPGVRDTKDLIPVTPQLEKKSWQLMKGFKLPQKLLAPKHSSSCHLNCQCWPGWAKEMSLLHIMPLMPYRISGSL